MEGMFGPETDRGLMITGTSRASIISDLTVSPKVPAPLLSLFIDQSPKQIGNPKIFVERVSMPEKSVILRLGFKYLDCVEVRILKMFRHRGLFCVYSTNLCPPLPTSMLVVWAFAQEVRAFGKISITLV